jgi:hypothetical protein
LEKGDTRRTVDDKRANIVDAILAYTTTHLNNLDVTLYEAGGLKDGRECKEMCIRHVELAQ